MRKLLELKEDKHADIIQIITKYKDDNQCTFVEAIRRLILLGGSCNGNMPEEEVCDESTKGRIDDIEKKLNVLIKVAQKKMGLEQGEENEQD
jgi:hypothetical protein